MWHGSCTLYHTTLRLEPIYSMTTASFSSCGKYTYCFNSIAAQVPTQTVHLATPNKWPIVLYSPHIAKHHKVIASQCST